MENNCSKTAEIIKKWYIKLDFPKAYDEEFYKALSEIAIPEDITIENYDCDSQDGKRNLLSFLYFAEKLSVNYKAKNIPENVLMGTLHDLVLWTKSWSEVKGELFLGELKWLRLHLTMHLFRIGRLQFAMGKALHDVEKYDVKKGEPIMEIHIPADGAMPVDECRKSIEMAKDFFAEYYPDFEYRYFTCHSWLLDDTLKEYLKEGSNILEFRKLFDVIEDEDSYALLRYIFRWDTGIENLDRAVCTSSFSDRIKKAAMDGVKFHQSYGFIKK